MKAAKKLEKKALTHPQRAKELQIVDLGTYRQAGSMLREIKGFRKTVDDTFDSAISKAHAAHKEMKAAKTKVEKPLEEAERILKAGIEKYHGQMEEGGDITKLDGVSVGGGWDFEIIDESKLERKYLVPDKKAIRKVVEGLGDRARIKGVKVIPRKTVSAKAPENGALAKTKA